MGAKQTKIDCTDFTCTPIAERTSKQFAENDLDPRSPAHCRTPIYIKNTNNENEQLTSVVMPERDPGNENTLDILRKRFLKSFTYHINDPRSPSRNLNRTPLVFEDTFEKSLTLDDTFADLFVESHLPTSSNKVETEKTATDNENVEDVDMSEEKVIIDLKGTAMVQQTPIGLQQKIDPRSPSVGVERTPIIFTDDEADGTNEDIMLENILATLSLNMNNSGSVVSMTSENIQNDLKVGPVNKHLDRVRTCAKNSPKGKKIPSQQKIYEDQENYMPMTPKLKVSQFDKNDSLKVKRSPLICLRNRNKLHARSLSVESSAKSIKNSLGVKSYDDSLNTSESCKISDSGIM